MPRLNLTEAETRTLILDEADRLFTEIGYDKTTIADIARACGFSSANVHRVLGTKGVINRAIAERKLAGKIEHLREAVEAVEGAPMRLRALYATVKQINQETFIEHKRVHQMVAAAIDERWEEVQRYRSRLKALSREIIAYGVERGEFNVPDVDKAASAVHSSGVRFCHPLLCAEMEGEPDDTDVDVWLEFVLRGLGQRVS
ncbi:TetR family transcriptional regulator [Parvularcula sp. ZS-1/3]|uniref:TetR family transcriptional regulator n=1 Tax=Parvularcula mediterranea TaxID=2732508 RepID=A0A7Y3RL90_9PROT|nr:TetR family transcriptional regulator [Parvularcula mediterranea]NNU16156.1 TetR family transcriptional regulator [Parvularcula mediterranea]